MSDVDVNTIEAGTYELVTLQWDEITSKPNEPFTFVRHRKGDKVELNESEAKRLVLAGAAVKPGSIQRAQAELALARYRAALAQLPPEMHAELAAGSLAVTVDGESVPIGAATAAGNGGEQPADGPPKKAEAKPAWVAYAVAQGMTEADAEALTKDELVAKYGG